MGKIKICVLLLFGGFIFHAAGKYQDYSRGRNSDDKYIKKQEAEIRRLEEEAKQAERGSRYAPRGYDRGERHYGRGVRDYGRDDRRGYGRGYEGDRGRYQEPKKEESFLDTVKGYAQYGLKMLTEKEDPNKPGWGTIGKELYQKYKGSSTGSDTKK